ncbi:MAG: DUF2442 domain-containing protein [Geminicoccaceae bacterium]
MLKDVAAVEPLEPYRMRLVFEDVVSGIVDVARLVPFEGVFAPLADLASFRNVRVERTPGRWLGRTGPISTRMCSTPW